MKTFDSTKLTTRIGIAAIIAGALFFAWFGVRWRVGNMLAELTPVSQANAAEIAQFAHRLAPSDPVPLWLAAVKAKENLADDDPGRAISLFENAVRRSPGDFRWWLELGRGYEQAERFDEAELAFKSAIELAPVYSFPRWQIGNFYLRRNRAEDAFAELKLTTEKSAEYREQVFSLAWDYFGHDPAMVENTSSDVPEARAGLAVFFAAHGAAEDALRLWNTLDDVQKAGHPQLPKNIAQGLYDRRFFRESLEFARQAGIDPEARQESVSNPGFEEFIGRPDETLFGWRFLRQDARMDLSVDSAVKKEGRRGLRVTFRGFTQPQLVNITQVVTVAPGQKYRLLFWLRTENLKSGGMPLFQIINANNGMGIAASRPFPIGTADWQLIELEFQAPENCSAVELRTAREYCDGECPIKGTFWYDGFELRKV